jgi:hypothetical protein
MKFSINRLTDILQLYGGVQEVDSGILQHIFSRYSFATIAMFAPFPESSIRALPIGCVGGVHAGGFHTIHIQLR